MKLDGTAAATPTVARKRAALFSALQYAVELELLPNKPLEHVKLPRPIIVQAVDRRRGGRRQRPHRLDSHARIQLGTTLDPSHGAAPPPPVAPRVPAKKSPLPLARRVEPELEALDGDGVGV